MLKLLCAALAVVYGAAIHGNATAQEPPTYPAPVEGDFIAKDFEFEDGNILDLRIYYRTIGELKRDENGRATNAVLIGHGTTGSGASLLRESFANVLFVDGGALDAEEYFIILPDSIGHGQSSKPSDGLRMKFPQYTYNDMVRAQYLLLSKGLDVDHLRLVMGTSMGGMQSWMWGYQYPDFVDAIMPLASLPVEIAGRNRMVRQLFIDAIKNDPAWNGGNYDEKPMAGMRAASGALMFMTSSPLQMQKNAPTREQSEEMLTAIIGRYSNALDPNDAIYAFDASRHYNPQPHLEKIMAPLVAINSADDQVNPPELQILETEIQRVANGRAIVLPITDETRGHGTHSVAALWEDHLRNLLAASERQ